MIPILLYSLLYLALFSFTEVLYHRLKVKVEYTRKIVHVFTGFIALTFPLYMDYLWQVLLLCGLFLLLMFLSERFKLFKSITAVKRKTAGSWLFALVVAVCFAVHLYLDSTVYYYLPVLILTVADPAAALVGGNFHRKPYKIWGQTKSVSGSLAFFAVTFILFLVFSLYQNLNFSLPLIVSASFVITLVEALSTKGLDNFTIPISTVVLLYTLF